MTSADPTFDKVFSTSDLAAHLGVTPHWMQSKLRTWPITVEPLPPVGTGTPRRWSARDLAAASAIHKLSEAIQLPVTRRGVYLDLSEHIHDPQTIIDPDDPSLAMVTIGYVGASVQVYADVPIGLACPHV